MTVGSSPRLFTPLFQLLLAVGLMVSALSGCRAKPGGQEQPPVPIAIAYPRNVSAGLVHIAIEKGYFSHRGGQVHPAAFESGKAALDRMLAGGADLAVMAETPIARAIMMGARLKILASIQQSGRDVGIVARRDRGIASPADLRGKRIGYTLGSSGQYFLSTFLLLHRISPGDTRLIDLSPTQLRSALIEGRVDAVSTWDPNVVFLTNALGTRAVLFRNEFIYTETFCVGARPEFIQEHPDQVKAILEGLLMALDFTARSPAEAKGIIAAYTQVDPALVARTYSNHDFDLRLDQSLLVSLEDECRWLLDSGAVPDREVPDLYGYLHLPGLLEVSPRAVQIIRYEDGGR